jgi:hypothetical protein
MPSHNLLIVAAIYESQYSACGGARNASMSIVILLLIQLVMRFLCTAMKQIPLPPRRPPYRVDGGLKVLGIELSRHLGCAAARPTTVKTIEKLSSEERMKLSTNSGAKLAAAVAAMLIAGSAVAPAANATHKHMAGHDANACKGAGKCKGAGSCKGKGAMCKSHAGKHHNSCNAGNHCKGTHKCKGEASCKGKNGCKG